MNPGNMTHPIRTHGPVDMYTTKACSEESTGCSTSHQGFLTSGLVGAELFMIVQCKSTQSRHWGMGFKNKTLH